MTITRGFYRPNPRTVDHMDFDAWCILINGEECEPGTAQCPSCGHMPTAGDEHRWQPDGTWTCASCGKHKQVVPYSIELPGNHPTVD
jgi:hypothetical protein